MTDTRDRHIHFYSTPMLPIYTIFCILGSLPFLAITIPLGLTVADDAVFGLLVMVGGPLGDILFRKVFKKIMLLFGNVQAIWVWPFIGLLVVVFRPFD